MDTSFFLDGLHTSRVRLVTHKNASLIANGNRSTAETLSNLQTGAHKRTFPHKTPWWTPHPRPGAPLPLSCMCLLRLCDVTLLCIHAAVNVQYVSGTSCDSPAARRWLCESPRMPWMVTPRGCLQAPGRLPLRRTPCCLVCCASASSKIRTPVMILGRHCLRRR